MRSTVEPHSIINIVGTIVSIVAICITAWMAVETRRMAFTATKALELEQAPILGLRDVKVSVSSGTEPANLKIVQVGIELFNAGRVLARYKVTSFFVTFSDRVDQTGRFLSRGGRILPGASEVFWHPGILLDPPVSTFPAKGKVRIQYEYWNELGQEVRSVTETVEYTLTGALPGSQTSWLRVDDGPAANIPMDSSTHL